MHKKDRKSHWRRTKLAKKKSCFSIASLMKDTSIQQHELNGYRTPNIDWVLRLNADGPEMPLRQRPEFVDTSKQCLKMQDAHMAEPQQSLRPIRPEHQQRQRQNQRLEQAGENLDCYVDRKTGWRCYREPR